MVGSAAARDFRARKQSPVYSEVFRIVICPSSSSCIILHRQRSDIAWSPYATSQAFGLDPAAPFPTPALHAPVCAARFTPQGNSAVP
ncbi:hypothetical protein I308_105821 [Cryptococcus tetragattii IND107]|uniref:Uncharacterized protein n=1 Tax=Cryptococcus tetragattii IND107 TaxID=1296105 RepID=A0ABR3BLU1_9TREE